MNKLILTFLAMVLVVGCKSDTDAGCTEGETQHCACPGGDFGVQTCLAGGTWEDCWCEGVDTSTEPDVPYDGPCRNDDDCDNGMVCDGAETCDSGTCEPGTAITCDDGDDCTTDWCDEADGDCVFDVRDEDGDGYVDTACGGEDCDDSRDDTYPGAPDDSCFDDLDKACDGIIDPTALYPTTTIYEGTGLATLRGATWNGSEMGFHWMVGHPGPSYFARADETGTPVGAVVDLGGTFADVVWAGSAYAVARHASTDVQFVWMSADGVVDSSPVTLEAPDPGSAAPQIAWSGSEIGVAWMHSPDSSDVSFARLDASGVILSSATAIETYPAIGPTDKITDVIWASSEWIVAWMIDDDAHLHLTWVTAAGAPEGTSVIVPDAVPLEIPNSLAWSGSHLGVIHSASPEALMLTLVDPDGAVIGSATQIDEYALNSSLTWTGSDFIAAAYTTLTSDAMGAFRISPDGVISASTVALEFSSTGNAFYWPVTWWTGSDVAVLWQGYTAASDFRIDMTKLGPCE